MTDQTTEPSYDEAPAAAPAVRVPNVSPGAVSGLDNAPLHGTGFVSFDAPVSVLPEAEDGGTPGENESQEDGEDGQEAPADPPVGEGTAEDGTAPQNDADEPGEQPGS